ncbi:MAG: hypothetical protein H0X01_02020 [Nitrospira sp.]|nr:hypothetical protein [Nitrospira sp.]
MKTKSAITGKYVSAKAAKAKPATTFKSDDYPARMLRKLIMLLELGTILFVSGSPEFDELQAHIANIKKKMGWVRYRKVK